MQHLCIYLLPVCVYGLSVTLAYMDLCHLMIPSLFMGLFCHWLQDLFWTGLACSGRVSLSACWGLFVLFEVLFVVIGV